MRFYLDEQMATAIAIASRQLGLDVISSHEAGRDGMDDPGQLLLAALDGRCFVSQNYHDMVSLTFEFQRRGLPHAGLVLVPQSLPLRDFGAVAQAILTYGRSHPDGVPPYHVDFLRRADSETPGPSGAV